MASEPAADPPPEPAPESTPDTAPGPSPEPASGPAPEPALGPAPDTAPDPDSAPASSSSAQHASPWDATAIFQETCKKLIDELPDGDYKVHHKHEPGSKPNICQFLSRAAFSHPDLDSDNVFWGVELRIGYIGEGDPSAEGATVNLHEVKDACLNAYKDWKICVTEHDHVQMWTCQYFDVEVGDYIMAFFYVGPNKHFTIPEIDSDGTEFEDLDCGKGCWNGCCG